MTALYQLTHELHDLHELVLSGEATEEMIADTLEALEGEFKQKALAVSNFIRNLDPAVEAIDAEIKRLQARKKAIQGRAERLKDYLRENMVAAEITRIDCDLFSILCKKPSAVAVIDAEDEIPDQYVEVKTTITPDKKSILKALKDGEDVPGARLDYGKAPIQIK